ncbi:GPP34 family phosphoprotein [Actinomadura fulvescens]|uniref:GPP34 family phosphoprotein n=1 Tax=Actinomadura fulvescens TaxID=46160 RepID=A0ABN3QQZ1_9ACTN
MEYAVPLADEFLLLALRDNDGRLPFRSAALQAGLAGALLADLALTGRITVGGDLVTVCDATPPDDPDLAAALGRIAGEAKPRKPEWWVSRLIDDDLAARRLARLTERGTVDATTYRVFGVIPGRRYSGRDAELEPEIRARLAAALDTGRADERTAVLLALAHASGLIARLSGISGRDLRERVEHVTAHHWAGKAVDRVAGGAALGAMANSAVAG